MRLHRKCGCGWCVQCISTRTSYRPSVKKIRLGHSRRACEVNLIRDQQQEPTESSPQLAVGASRNPLLSGKGRMSRKAVLSVHFSQRLKMKTLRFFHIQARMNRRLNRKFRGGIIMFTANVPFGTLTIGSRLPAIQDVAACAEPFSVVM